MGKKFNCDIMAKSTFSDEGGTKICQKIESSEIKSIVKNDHLVVIEIETNEFYPIYQSLLQNNIIVEDFKKIEKGIQFRIKKSEESKVIELLDSKNPSYKIKKESIVKLSIIGYGVIQDTQVLNLVIETLKEHQIGIMDINLTQAKIEVIVEKMKDSIVNELHQQLIK